MTLLRAAADATATVPTVLVLNGPSLNRLGERQLEIYGATTLTDVELELCALVRELSAVVDCCQSNYEDQLIRQVRGAANYGRPAIIGPGGLTHASVALCDALVETVDDAGFYEVRISNIHARGEFRYRSYLSALAMGVIVGCGTDNYSMVLRRMSTTL